MRRALVNWLAGTMGFALLGVVRWLLGAPDGAELVWSATRYALVGVVALSLAKWARQVLAVVLAAFLVLALASQLLSPYAWRPDLPNLVRWRPDVFAQEILGRESPRSAYRAWRLSTSQPMWQGRPTELLLQLRAASGAAGSAWLTSDGAAWSASPLPGVASRLTFASSGDPFAYVRGLLAPGRPRPVRANIAVSAPAHTCGRVALVDWVGKVVDALSVCLEGGARATNIALSANLAAGPDGGYVDLVLTSFQGGALDVGTPVFQDGSQVPMPGLPQGAGFELVADDGMALARVRLLPNELWRNVRLSVDPDKLVGLAGELRLIADVEAETSVLVRRLRWDAPTGTHFVASAPTWRHGYGTGHPNLAGHSLAIVALALWAVWRSHERVVRWWSRARLVLVLVATALAVLGTGSRAAFGVLIVGVPLLAMVAAPRRTRDSGARFKPPGQRMIAYAALAGLIVSGALAYIFAEVAWSRRGNVESADRLSVWSAAVQSIWSSPLAGNSDRLMVEGQEVAHAHNWLLEHGRRYGLPGLLAALGLLVGALGAARVGGPTALTLLLLVLVLGTIDITPTYVWVITPAALVVFNLAHQAAPPRRRKSSASLRW